MAFYGLFGEKEPDADLAVDEAVGDELQDFDLARGGSLLGLGLARCDGDHLGGRRPTGRGDGFEALRVLAVAGQDCITLRRIHSTTIGGRPGGL